MVLKLRAHTQFGPKNTLAPSILRPEVHFGPRNTSAPIILRPGNTSTRWLLRPGNTSAKNNFSPIHFGPRIKFLSVILCLPLLWGCLRVKFVAYWRLECSGLTAQYWGIFRACTASYRYVTWRRHRLHFTSARQIANNYFYERNFRYFGVPYLSLTWYTFYFM